MLTARQENNRTLARLAGISEDEAASRLSFKVAIHCSSDSGAGFTSHLRRLLAFTVEIVDAPECANLVVAVNAPAYDASHLHIAITDSALVVGRTPSASMFDTAPHDLSAKLAACYAASVIVAHAIGGERLANLTLPFAVPFSRFGLTPELLARTVDLHDTVLAGAGGVGSGFLWALESLDVKGTLDIADPKTVTPGGLNRSHHYGDADIGSNKADALCKNARLPNVELIPFIGTFSELCKQRFRVKRVIVTVDSRPARRTIQSDLPFEVLDASTTDASAVVVHSHAEPNRGACLACIYHHIPLEDERTRSIAGGLGVAYEEIAGKELIDAALAERLAALHNLQATELEGQAITSLHKSLCAAQILSMAGGEQALAPFAFISNLAGVLLAIELLRFEAEPDAARDSTYLSLDPWSPPHARARRPRAKRPDCEFCADPNAIVVRNLVWKDRLTPDPQQDDRAA